MGFAATIFCFSNADGIPMHHSPGLVVVSYLVAVIGSFTALEMIERWKTTAGLRAAYWHALSATLLGCSVWSMHFIGILALQIGVPLTFAPGETVLSLLIAIGAVGWGLQIVRAGASPLRLAGAGLAVGLGIAAMHYVGMAGIRFPGTLAYEPRLWGLSLLVAIGAATTAMWLSLTLQERWQRAVAALVMGAAICGMHYVGIAATVFEISPTANVAPGLSSALLAATVALATLALTLCALVQVGADRRFMAYSTREAELLRQSHAQLTEANASLELGRQQTEAMLSNIAQGVCLFDGSGRLLVSNRRYAEVYSLPVDKIRVGCSLSEIVDLRVAAGSAPDMSRSEYMAWHTEFSARQRPLTKVLTLKNGRIVAVCHQPMADGGWVSTHDDVTERQRAEASLAFMACHDALTRLANRLLFNERLELARLAAGRGAGYAVLCLDLDNFKQVNDSLGHPVGDGLLQAAAERLQGCVREGDTVARLGGDEFAIVHLGVGRPDDAAVLANRIIGVFAEPFDVDGHRITVGISIGVALAPGDGTSSETLLKGADVALYLAKTEGRGTVRFFEPEMDARIRLRRVLEADLHQAIIRKEFELYYQPLVNVAAGKIIGFEALLRWHHPVRGLVSPADFLPVAEDTGVIVPIGEWVLRMACFEAENWPTDVCVAVNLSPVQFKKGDIVASVRAALDASGLDPHRLELEITESVLLQDTAGVLMALHELRGMGISIALDDFGTGYSSLSYLRSFPFDKIKIDQSFVRDVVKNKDCMSIIRAITGLGHSLRMNTTAEGVETAEQLDMLRAEGCTEVQGFYFSVPRPARELPDLIASLVRSPGPLVQQGSVAR